MTALPSNEESLFGICSIHCYDPLMSRRFQKIVKRWGKAGMEGDGRLYRSLDRESLADSGEALSLAGVKYLVTEAPLVLPWIESLGKIDRFFIYKNRLPPRMRFQTNAFVLDDPRAARLTAVAMSMVRPINFTAIKDDRLRVPISLMGSDSLLFLSQQFHDYWQASSGGRQLKTVVVNDFYQGVLLPPGTKEVDLRFMSWSRWSWIPQAVFAILGLTYIYRKTSAGQRGFRRKEKRLTKPTSRF